MLLVCVIVVAALSVHGTHGTVPGPSIADGPRDNDVALGVTELPSDQPSMPRSRVASWVSYQ